MGFVIYYYIVIRTYYKSEDTTMANNDPILDDEFEYNDGLGDLLREKQRLEFNLPKTLLVVGGLALFCIIAIFTLSQVSNKLFVESPELPALTQIETATNNPLVQSQSKVSIEKKPRPSSKHLPSSPLKDPKTGAKKNGIQTQSSQKKATFSRISKFTPPAKRLSKSPSTSTSVYRVIVGTFTQSKNAHRMVQQLKKKKIDSFVWARRSKNKTIYRVQVGAFKQVKTARNLENSLKKKGIDAYTIK